MDKNLKTKEELFEILKKVATDPEYLDEFSYEDEPEISITCTVWGEEIYPFVRDVGPAEYAEDEYTIDFEYDKDDLITFLTENIEFIDENGDDVVKIVYDLDSGDTRYNFCETFLSSLTSLYMEEIIDHYYDDAQEQAQEAYDEDRESAREAAEVDRWESSLEDREQDYYERAADYYDNLY